MSAGEAAPGPLVITIDGPAASGKSSTAKVLSRRLGLAHLDSGALYRAVALILSDAGRLELLDEEGGARLQEFLSASGLVLSLNQEGSALFSNEGRLVEAALRRSGVACVASRAAAHPAVRAFLLEIQRGAAPSEGVVADGRDMGTVVFPDATLKVYLDADAETRARRRLRERSGRHPGRAEIAREVGRIKERDARDRRRASAPLRAPPGCFRLDTTRLTLKRQAAKILDVAAALHPAAAAVASRSKGVSASAP